MYIQNAYASVIVLTFQRVFIKCIHLTCDEQCGTPDKCYSHLIAARHSISIRRQSYILYVIQSAKYSSVISISVCGIVLGTMREMGKIYYKHFTVIV